MFFQDKNWFTTIAFAHLRNILWAAGITSVVVLLFTLATPTVYKARTVLVVDADFASVLRGMDIPYPTKNQGDFIRYEYFATHAVALMSDTVISRQVIESMGLKAGSRELKAEKFINPSIANLLFSNGGQGVAVKWLADTQQFAVTGYSRDPDMACKISEKYARIFLENNARQYDESIQTMLRGVEAQIEGYETELVGINEAMRQLRIKSGADNPANQLELANARVSALETSLNERKLAESIYKERMEELLAQEAGLDQLRTMESAFEANPMIVYLQKEIGSLTSSLAKASVDYTPLHPARKSIENQIRTLEGQLKSEMEKTFSSETLKVPDALNTVLEDVVTYSVAHRTFGPAVAAMEATIAAEKEKSAGLAQAAMEMSTLNSKKSDLLDHMATARLKKSGLESVALGPLPIYRIVSLPEINMNFLKFYKHFPKRKSLLLKSLLGVVFLSAVFATGRELYSQTIYRGWQAEEALPGIPCFELPSSVSNVGNDIPSHHQQILSLWKMIRESKIVVLKTMDRGLLDFIVSKCFADCWKASGKTTLVVDGRIQQHEISSAAGLSDCPGLSEYLQRKEDFEKIVHRCDLYPSGLVPSGSASAQDNAASPAGSEFGFFDKCFSISDHLVFSDGVRPDDSAAILEDFPDCDWIVLVEAGQSSRSDLEQLAKAAERSFSARIKAVVLGGIPVTANPATLQGFRQLVSHLATPPFKRTNRQQIHPTKNSIDSSV